MGIPDYQSFMLPLLKYISDKKVYHIRDAYEEMAKEFNLTEEEKSQLLPSGKQPTFENRVGWARTYMKKAGLIKTPERGYIQITERGKEVLSENPTDINRKFLTQFEEFQEFQSRSTTDEEADSGGDQSEMTPAELIESAYLDIRQTLVDELLEQVHDCTAGFFEELVVDLLVNIGYGGSRREAGRAIGKSHDEGIDGIIKEDRLGLDIIYIQAKRWEGSVSRPEIQKFAGALQGQRAKKGIFITTSSFSEPAIEYASNIDTKIILIDGETLANYMIDYNIGISVKDSYEIKRLDYDYFIEE